MKKLSLLTISILLFALACSKDRGIFLKNLGIKEKKFTESPDKKLKEAATPPEKKTIASDDDLPIVGKQGTELWLEPGDLVLPDGTQATYPIQVEILEVYKPKDMILNRISTVSFGRMLSTAGQVKITASKDGKPLTLSKNNNTSIDFPATSKLDREMALFYGIEENGSLINWVGADTIRKKVPLYLGRDGYSAFPSKLGWINVDKFINSTEPITEITFQSEYPTIDKIEIYLYFPDLKSVMRNYGDKSGLVPIGSKVKVIAISITDKDEWYSFSLETTVQDKQKIDIKLAPTTKEDLMKYLDTL